MNFDWLDNALWKPIGKGLSEVDTFVKREMPFHMGWGAPAALAAAIAAPQIIPALAGSGEAAAGLGEAGGLTEGLTQGGSIVNPMAAGYGENLGGLGFNTAAEQQAMMDSGGLFSSGGTYGNSMAFPEGFTQGGPIYVDPTVPGYGENLSSIPGYGFNQAAEQQAMMDSGGAFSSGSSPSYGGINDYLKQAGIDTGTSADKAFQLKDKGLDYGKLLASALKGIGGQKKAATPQQYVMQQLQNRNQQQQQVQSNVNQLAMPVIGTQGIVQEPNMALAQQLRRSRY